MGEQVLRVRLFGTPELTLDGTPLTVPSSPKARSLLGYLIIHPNRPVVRERLLGIFWPDRPESFAVVPPPDAMPSRLIEATLAKGVEETPETYEPMEPTTTFSPDDAVYVVGVADLGKYSRLEVNWPKRPHAR